MHANKLFLAAALVLSPLLCALPGYAQPVRIDNSELSTASQTPAYEWTEEGDAPKAVVIIVHGLTQQGLSVDTLARTLARQHYLVLAMDQRGHGRWHYEKEKVGGFVADYKRSMLDLGNLCQTVRQRYPGLPLFCIGESCGSALIAQAAARNPQLVDGIVLCSPGTRPRVYNPFWVMHDLVCNLVRFDHPVDLRRYIRRYASDDPRVVEEMLHDPLARNDMSERELFRTVALIRRTPRAVKHIGNDMPLLMVQGSRDHILAAKTVSSLLRRFQTPNKELLVLPDCGHVLLGTSYIRPAVSGGITHWLDSQVSVQVSDGAQIARNTHDDTHIDSVELSASH